MGDPNIADLLVRLAASPDVYVQKLDFNRNVALAVHLDADGYRGASFLDDRILRPGMRGTWVAIPDIVSTAQDATNIRPLRFIFHSGHVGSTLISRLLDESGIVLSLREPYTLRQLADAHDAVGDVSSLLSPEEFDALLASFLRLWGRGYEATRFAIVKATSVTGRLAPAMFANCSDLRGIYLNLRSEAFLATLLAGQNSYMDLRGHAVERIKRLQSNGFAGLAPLYTLSPGEMAAMAWLAETCSQHDAFTRLGQCMIAIDFDRFLADVAGGMQRIVEHFGMDVAPGFYSTIARSPSLTKYSKAPEHAYSPDLRARILADSRARNGIEIRKGLAWLEGAAKSNPRFGEIFSRAG